MQQRIRVLPQIAESILEHLFCDLTSDGESSDSADTVGAHARYVCNRQCLDGWARTISFVGEGTAQSEASRRVVVIRLLLLSFLRLGIMHRKPSKPAVEVTSPPSNVSHMLLFLPARPAHGCFSVLGFSLLSISLGVAKLADIT